ncbi:hypothetical protein B5C26_10460 [Photorhabdus luminescens]|nr:hypothetical protein B5C26_10460 [Photorhabdus luminescens]
MNYTRYLSSCLFVGCAHSPRSQSYLCPRGFAPFGDYNQYAFIDIQPSETQFFREVPSPVYFYKVVVINLSNYQHAETEITEFLFRNKTLIVSVYFRSKNIEYLLLPITYNTHK